MNAPSVYRDFIRAYASNLREGDRPATNKAEWRERSEQLRERVLAAVGPMPTEDCPLNPQILGEIRRDGYVIERLILQTQPNVWMTANLFRPEPAPISGPAVLVVHGHWSLARVEPVVQSRCLGLVKLGFTVLCVDAFGSGERFTNPAPGTYHGALYGGPLWPAGQTLLAIQIYDNRRAVDYLLSRPEVDPARIGVTGESGGGNQTMYAGAFDRRLRCVVPVCSVGNYQSYLLVECCTCEVIPGALTFTEEGDVLGLTAPRPLLVVSAAKDNIQFSPAEAAKSVARAKVIYGLHDAADRLRHDSFDAGHGYDRSMREAMYGWMSRWLKNEGDGTPIPEPTIATEDPASLRCYPNPDDRPRDWLFPPTLAHRVGTALLDRQFQPPPDRLEDWTPTRQRMLAELKQVLGPIPVPAKIPAELGPPAAAEQRQAQSLKLTPEPGMPLYAAVISPVSEPFARTCIFVHPDGSAEAIRSPAARALRDGGWTMLMPDLRATGKSLAAPPNARLRDYQPAEHGVWVGRPLLGQWVLEVTALLEWVAIQPQPNKRVILAGEGVGGMVALATALLAPNRVSAVVAVKMPATCLCEGAYGDVFRMGAIVPNMFRAGDLPHLAAGLAPLRLVIAGPLSPRGEPLPESSASQAFAYCRGIYRLLQAERQLSVTPGPDWEQLVRGLS